MKLSLQKLLKVLILSYGIQSLESIVVNDDIGGDSNLTPSVLAVGDDDTYRRVIVKYIGEPEDTQSSVRKSVSRSVNMITSVFVKETNAEIMMLNDGQIKELEEDRNVEFVENGEYQQVVGTTMRILYILHRYACFALNTTSIELVVVCHFMHYCKQSSMKRNKFVSNDYKTTEDYLFEKTLPSFHVCYFYLRCESLYDPWISTNDEHHCRPNGRIYSVWNQEGKCTKS
jgi:hypothetical protein